MIPPAAGCTGAVRGTTGVMASDADDRASQVHKTPTDDTAAAEGGYGERSLSGDVSAEDARGHAADVEGAHSGPTDTEGILRRDVPHASAPDERTGSDGPADARPPDRGVTRHR